MNILNKRPLLIALLAFLLTSVLCTALTAKFKIMVLIIEIVIAIILIIVFSALATFRGKRLRGLFNTFILLMSCIFAIVGSINFFDKTLYKIENLGTQRNVVFKIEECTYRTTYLAVYTAHIESIAGKNVDFMAEISTEYFLELEDGKTICANMTFEPFNETIYGFDERNTNISNGILVSASFSDAKIIESNNLNFSIVDLFNSLRKTIAKRIDRSTLLNSAPLIKALLLGYDDEIDTDVKLDFRRLGISHILSISGTHFTVLLGIFTLLLSAFGLNKRTIYVILVPVSLFYMGLSGFSFPVCRAGIMSIISYSAFLFGRERDSYTALFFSAAVIILIFPYSVISLGLWLSFVATFAIIFIIDLFGEKGFFKKGNRWYTKILYFAITHLMITLSVSFFTLPITAIYFGETSLVAPLANLIIVPLFELYLYIIPFTVILIDFAPLVSLTELFGNGLLSVMDTICQIDGLLISIRQNFVVIIAVIGIIATLILATLPLRKKALTFLPATISLISIFIGVAVFMQFHSRKTYVSYFNSGVSDGIAVVDNNSVLCIDISNGSSSAAYYSEHVADELYCPEIGGYLFTHYHALHINQFEKLTNRTHVKSVYLPEAIFEDDIDLRERICNIAFKKNIDIVEIEYDVPFSFEDCSIMVFKPQMLSRSTHEPISLKISTGAESILYLGSSFSETGYDFNEHAKNASFVFFGQHHPTAKKEFYVPTHSKVIFGNESIYALSGNKTGAVVLNNGDRYDIVLK